MLDASIFRSYDIRGIVGETITAENFFFIGKAIGSLLRENNENQIVLARDGRVSSPALAEQLTAGLLSTGCDVTDIGMVPTPLLYYATQRMSICSGVVITGSHNPGNYNGVKIVVQGKVISDVEIQALYQRIKENRFHDGAGTRTEKSIKTAYLEEIERNIFLSRPLRVVVDAGNGVTGELAPALYQLLGCEVHPLYCDIDGRFPNHHPDPVQAENLQDLVRVVREKKADIGLAFDGDGDRLGVVTHNGQIIEADRLLMLFARSLLAEKPQAKVVFDVKCTNHLPQLIQALGGEPLMCRTGHAFIKQKIREINADLGGEMSGHLFFNDRWHGFDDALYAGARLLELIASAEDAESIFADIPQSVITPELKIAVDEHEKFPLMQRLIDAANFQEAKDINTIDGMRVSFHEGWGLLRPSNTTPYLVLRFEAESESVLKNIQCYFREWLLSVKPELELPF